MPWLGGIRVCPRQHSGLVSPGNSVAAQNDEAEIEDVIEQARVSAMALDKTISLTRSIISSYPSMINPDKGASLTFFQTQVVIGVKCASIESKDVLREIEYWKSAVLCSVLGANPPFEVIEGFIRHIWRTFDIDKIYLVKKGVFLVRFKHLSEQSIVV
ncbi:hypothetical protein Cgig2_030529 [Carnegiea gigantea]|uniref:Uncharacterized protein n=1 Tax=Carnegiea gigantea TaxID=171969 RepID=A0A9Q1GG84_9CARY|nr:hypothetical protein Cgig2_030529 [Carnegiea gigantea]